MEVDSSPESFANIEWNQFFQETMCESVMEAKERHMYSENGIDIDITQSQIEKCMDCLLKLGKAYETIKIIPNANHTSCVINIAAYVSQKEQQFILLNSNNVYKIILVFVEKQSTEIQIKLSFLDLLRSFLQHNGGIKWLMETSYWKIIYEIVIKCQGFDIHIKENAHNILSKILQKSFKVAPKICYQIVKQMVELLINVESKHRSAIAHDFLTSTELLQLADNIICLVEILERLLASPTTDILKYFMKLQVRNASDKFSAITNDTQLSLNLSRITTILSFYELTEVFDGIKVVNHDPIALSGFLTIIEREMKKGHIKTILELYYYAQKYWKNVSRKMPKYFVKEKPIDIEDELMSFQVEPLVVIAEKLIGVPMTSEEELRNCFLADLLNLYSVSCLQLGYEIRKHLANLPLEIEIIALECLIKSKPLYSRKNVAIVFQVLIYSLRDFTRYAKQSQLLDQFNQKFADTLLEAILVYLENFNLSWRESIGSIELTNLVYQFLSYSSQQWPAEVVAKGLEVLNMTISKHMSPNMALLVDTTQYSSLNELGTMLFTKCFCTQPQVRNAALNVICTLCHKSNKVDALLPDLVLTMSIEDDDRQCRATALKCLKEFVEMKQIGQVLLGNDLIIKMLTLFSRESESMVIKEIVSLMEKIYLNEDIPEQQTKNMYNVLMQAALNKDPDVQQRAIDFWKNVTKDHLEKQGMIDGEFPPVIFSKESKKIVKLDDKEIRKRLFKALNNMSSAGCFDVFHYILQNEVPSRKVFRSVVVIVNRLLKLLQKYEVTPEFILFNQTYPNLWSIQSIISSPSNRLDADEKMNEIIEDTVMEMINNCDYDDNSKGPDNESTMNEIVEFQEKNQQVRISTVDFLDFIYKKLPHLNQESMEMYQNNYKTVA